MSLNLVYLITQFGIIIHIFQNARDKDYCMCTGVARVQIRNGILNGDHADPDVRK